MKNKQKMTKFILLFLTLFSVLMFNKNSYAAGEISPDNIYKNDIPWIAYILEIDNIKEIYYYDYAGDRHAVEGYEYIAEIINNSNDGEFSFTKNDIQSVTSNNPNILKVVSSKKLVAKDAGATYLEVKMKETNEYKPFTIRIPVVIYPTTQAQDVLSNKVKLIKGKYKYIPNTLAFSAASAVMGATISKNCKLRIDIAKDKKFKKIVKSYNLNYKYSNKSKVKEINNIKKIGLKKNKIYYIRAYAYKKYKGQKINSTEYFYRKFKFNKKGIIKIYKISRSYNDMSHIKPEEMLKLYDINYVDLDYDYFDEMYKK